MASSSAVAVYNKKYDVFLCFRGSDIRKGFLSHLRKALLDHKIEAFVDEQLERGSEISESLLEKIGESLIAVVIFSQNFAHSEWCLKELLKIVECRNSDGQIVIPVFYGVDPSHVQDLTGSYDDAMALHRTQFDESLVEKWASALKDTTSLSGLVSSNFKTESNLIEEIVKRALNKLNCLYPSHSSRDGGLVGIDSRVEKVMSLLCGTEDVCAVGIWGEGGIGKTTLARATFDRIRGQFDSKCFVGDVREKFEKFTTDSIRNEVVSKLFGTNYSDMTRKRLSRKKIILVLDDVSDLDQIKSIMCYKLDFGCGSRIIVTSRDSHLLKNMGAETYAVEKLDDHEALQLFCLNAFNNKFPQEGYLELSKRAVEYARGLPLALEVLGSNLFQRSAEEWEDELEKLKGTSDRKILKILRVSYDGLSDLEKEIFLDISCFFRGKKRDEVESLLDIAGSKIGISRLAEKALISISSKNRIKMHALIQQMARDIICEEKTPEKRRGLWNPVEIYFLLTREMGTEAVRGISLDMSKIKGINLNPAAFRKLYNLRYINFYSSSDNIQLFVPHGLEYLPEQLRYLYWHQYPSKSLPVYSLWAEKLVKLDMHDSQLEELWKGVQNLPNLKSIDLSRSTKLIKVPDLSTASNLESLNFYMCESLVEIPSLKFLSKLIQLKLLHCSRLESLPDDICNLNSLVLLDVSYCKNLHRLPQNLGNLKSLEELGAFKSGLEEFPESFCNLKKLKILNVENCVNLHRLPQNLGNLESQEQLLSVTGAHPHNICNLSARVDVQNFRNLESLQYLHVGGSGIKELPSSINYLRGLRYLTCTGSKDLILPPLIDLPNLWKIHLTECGFSEFPMGLCFATSLRLLFLPGNNFESIPESIGNLRNLEHLNLHGCKKLKCLPESIQRLVKLYVLALKDCQQLEYLPESIKLLPLMRYLDMRGCTSLNQNRCSKLMDHLIMANIEERRKYHTKTLYPGSQVPKRMVYKNNCGSSLSFTFKLLEHEDNELGFYVSVVLDRPIFGVVCKGNFMDESGLSFSVEGGKLSHEGVYFPLDSVHVLMDSMRFTSENFARDCKCTAEFQFQCSGVDEDGLYDWRSDWIMKCGVIPLFAYEKVEWYITRAKGLCYSAWFLKTKWLCAFRGFI